MQIMKFGKLVKKFWWIVTASKTIENLPDCVIYSDTSGYILKDFRDGKIGKFILDVLP